MDFTDVGSSTEHFVHFTQNIAFLSEDQIWPSARTWPPSLHIYIYICIYVCVCVKFLYT